MNNWILVLSIGCLFQALCFETTKASDNLPVVSIQGMINSSKDKSFVSTSITRDGYTKNTLIESDGGRITKTVSEGMSDGRLITSKEREEIAKKWAPLVWLDPKEKFFPGSVIQFLQHVTPSKPGDGDSLTIYDGDSQIVLPPLPSGKSSRNAFLVAPYDKDCLKCLPKFSYGQKPTETSVPPVYAQIHSCNFRQPKKMNKAKPSTKKRRGLRNGNINIGHSLGLQDSVFINPESPPSLLNQTHYDNLENKPTETPIPTPTGTFWKRKKKRNVINDSIQQEFSVTYWMFYPFNYGKSMCTFFGKVPLLSINGFCPGKKITMGNHFGDWEHITIQFKGRTPTEMYVSTHTFGGYYAFNPDQQEFHYKSDDSRDGIGWTPEYHHVLKMQETHPILYVARESHGLWASPGTHRYQKLLHLEDITGEGTAWRTWQNVQVINLKHKENLTPEQRHWASYEGRWGNPKNNCHLLMAGYCEVDHGPTGIPMKRINYPC